MKPEEPKVIILPELKDIPPQNIEITEPPKFGTITVNPDSSLTYVSNLSDPTSTVVDKFTVTFTDLSGAVIVAGREIVLAQDGDVPSIIQTGLRVSGTAAPFIYFFTLISLLVGAVITFRRRKMSGLKTLSIFAIAVMTFSFVVQPVSQPSAEASCKPVKPKGKTIGRILVGDVDMPIKGFTYRAGGIMEPRRQH